MCLWKRDGSYRYMFSVWEAAESFVKLWKMKVTCIQACDWLVSKRGLLLLSVWHRKSPYHPPLPLALTVKDAKNRTRNTKVRSQWWSNDILSSFNCPSVDVGFHDASMWNVRQNCVTSPRMFTRVICSALLQIRLQEPTAEHGPGHYTTLELFVLD